MQENVGAFDRVIRIALGVALGAAALWTVGFETGLDATSAVALATVLAFAGAVLLGTAVARTCPLYRVLGVSTRDRDTAREDRRGGDRNSGGSRS